MVQWTRTFPSSCDTIIWQVRQTRDGGYVGAGRVLSRPGRPGSKINLLKMDSVGNTQWVRFFGCDTLMNVAVAVEQTSDGGYVLAGNDDSLGLCGINVIKTDSLGNQQWRFNLRTFVTIYDVQQTADGGYVVSGMRINYGLYLLKLSPLGTFEWARSYEESYGDWTDRRCRVRQTSDGGYILVAEVLLKTDSLGNEQWRRRYSGVNVMFSVDQTSDGGYIAAGHGPSPAPAESLKRFNMVLLKTDSQGNLQWKKVFTEGQESGGLCAIQTADGGYLVCGDIVQGDLSHGRLVKTDSQGTAVWTKSLEPRTVVRSCQQTSDGGYILTQGYNHIWKLAPEQE
ncbi:MAG: hypothetical protein ABIK44_07695 [candidate division WOR-3 bacterium]